MYNIILADPPWPYNARNNPKTRFGLGMHRYPPMSIDAICKLPVAEIADDDCALFLWITCPKIKHLLQVMRAWGFEPITKAFCWEKIDKKGNPRLLSGHYTGSNTEDCWLGGKGRLYHHVKDKGVNQVIRAALSEHSRKPPEARDRIVRLFGDLPRVELFATEQAPGWDCLGNMIDGRDINTSLRSIITKEKALAA